jgi:hypothetical protein
MQALIAWMLRSWPLRQEHRIIAKVALEQGNEGWALKERSTKRWVTVQMRFL